MSETVLFVVPSSARPGVCGFCKKAVIWVTVPRQNGRRARTVPFHPQVTSLGNAEPVTPEGSSVSYIAWPVSLLHSETCTNKPKPDPTHRRHVRAARDGQGRIV